MSNIKIIKEDGRHTFQIGKKAYSHTATTYDEAMILALAVKYDGINTQAHKMFMRMINIKSVWTD